MAEGGPGSAGTNPRQGGGPARTVAIATCPEPLPAHERTGERAINVVGWAVDESGAIQGVCVRGDGSVHLVDRESILFDHAVRPTDY